MCSATTTRTDTPLLMKASVSVNKSNTHSLRRRAAHTLTHCSPFYLRAQLLPQACSQVTCFPSCECKVCSYAPWKETVFPVIKITWHLARSRQSQAQDSTEWSSTSQRRSGTASVYTGRRGGQAYVGLKQYQGSAT